MTWEAGLIDQYWQRLRSLAGSSRICDRGEWHALVSQQGIKRVNKSKQQVKSDAAHLKAIKSHGANLNLNPLKSMYRRKCY